MVLKFSRLALSTPESDGICLDGKTILRATDGLSAIRTFQRETSVLPVIRPKSCHSTVLSERNRAFRSCATSTKLEALPDARPLSHWASSKGRSPMRKLGGTAEPATSAYGIV